MFARFLFVFDLQFNLYRVALWSSIGKELPPWLFAGAVVRGDLFAFGVYGRMWNSIVSVPHHCLSFIYFKINKVAFATNVIPLNTIFFIHMSLVFIEMQTFLRTSVLINAIVKECSRQNSLGNG